MTGHDTLILTREDIARLMTMRDYIDAVEGAFRALGEGRMHVPGVGHIPAPDGGFHIKSAAWIGEPHYVAVKVNGNFPDNPRANGLPTIQGAILLFDGTDGRLLAIMDSIEITAMRTAAATAVAAKYLANAEAKTATIIGCGVQGRVQLLALLEVLPLETIYAHDLDRKLRDAFVEQLRAETSREIVAVDDFANGTTRSQVIVTCTPSRKSFLRPAHVAPGAFIAAVGADSHDKQELDTSLVAGARVIVDLLDQCADIGELRHAIAAGAMTSTEVAGELGDVVGRAVRPRVGPTDRVVFDSTGSAIQDVAAAGVAYARAQAGEFKPAIRLG